MHLFIFSTLRAGLLQHSLQLQFIINDIKYSYGLLAPHVSTAQSLYLFILLLDSPSLASWAASRRGLTLRTWGLTKR